MGRNSSGAYHVNGWNLSKSFLGVWKYNLKQAFRGVSQSEGKYVYIFRNSL